jgi:hypothetical protein
MRYVERTRAETVRFTDRAVDGRRLILRVEDTRAVEVNQPRRISIDRRTYLRGEVDDVLDGRVVLYVTDGKPATSPLRGDLEYDSSAAEEKLRRERRALDDLLDNRSVRPDLSELLLDPRRNRSPRPADVETFVQPELDDAKREAVRVALGTEDFLLVQGPPGTGKTTFIAELVSHVLKRDRGCRVLITSQTHIALDNALEAIRGLCPDAALLRLGRPDKIGSEVDDLTVDRRLVAWRSEVLAKSRAFLDELAHRLGYEVPELDVRAVGLEIAEQRAQLKDLRSRIQLRQAERRRLLDEVSTFDEFAASVFDTAAQVEAAASGTVGDLTSAAERFIEAGLALVSSLESGAGLRDELLEMETSLKEWRDAERDRASAEAKLREDLATALGTDADDVDSLLEQAERAGPQGDPAFSRLVAIAQEWEERFGATPDFHGALVMRSDVVLQRVLASVGCAAPEL